MNEQKMLYKVKIKNYKNGNSITIELNNLSELKSVLTLCENDLFDGKLDLEPKVNAKQEQSNFDHWIDNTDSFIQCPKCNVCWDTMYNDTKHFCFCPYCGSRNKFHYSKLK